MYFPYSKYFNFFKSSLYLDEEYFDLSFETFKILANLKAYYESVSLKKLRKILSLTDTSDVLHKLNLPPTEVNKRATNNLDFFFNVHGNAFEDVCEFEDRFSFEPIDAHDQVEMKLSLFNMIEDHLTARLYAHLLYCEQHNKFPSMYFDDIFKILKVRKGHDSEHILKYKIANSLKNLVVIDSQLDYRLDFILSNKFNRCVFNNRANTHSQEEELANRTKILYEDLIGRLACHRNLSKKVLYVGKIECGAIFYKGAWSVNNKRAPSDGPFENSDGYHTWRKVKLIPVDLKSYFHVASL